MTNFVDVSTEVWDNEYQGGRWDFLSDNTEYARYNVIYGYIRKYSAKGNVLDLGCGEGVLYNFIEHSDVTNYTGVDISKVAIKKALERTGGDFHNADISLYTPCDYFNTIVFNEVLHYLPNPIETINRYLNYSKINGVIILSLYMPAKANDLYNKIARSIIKGLIRCKDLKIIDRIELTNILAQKRWQILTAFKT